MAVVVIRVPACLGVRSSRSTLPSDEITVVTDWLGWSQDESLAGRKFERSGDLAFNLPDIKLPTLYEVRRFMAI